MFYAQYKGTCTVHVSWFWSFPCFDWFPQNLSTDDQDLDLFWRSLQLYEYFATLHPSILDFLFFPQESCLSCNVCIFWLRAHLEKHLSLSVSSVALTVAFYTFCWQILLLQLVCLCCFSGVTCFDVCAFYRYPFGVQKCCHLLLHRVSILLILLLSISSRHCSNIRPHVL